MVLAPTDDTPVQPSLAETTASLSAVIQQGQDNIRRQAEEYSKRWEATVAESVKPATADIEISGAGIDEDIKTALNNSPQSAIRQELLQRQMARTLCRMQMLLQAVAVKIGGIDAPQTKEAAQAVADGTL